jgi:D-alanyl-D-alanine carboxypeptidase
MRRRLLAVGALALACATKPPVVPGPAGTAPGSSPPARSAPGSEPGRGGPTGTPPAGPPPPTDQPLSPAPPAAGAAPLPWVNPARCLPACDQTPPDLVRIDERGAADAAGAFQVQADVQAPLAALIAAGRAAGHPNLRVSSAFRGYTEQARVFRTTREVGRAARPGHSEHQLGTAVDLRLSTSATGTWLAAHAPGFGFVLSYPPGKQRITGYRPEPWHVRFVGAALAAEVAANGWALEELFRSRPQLGASGDCGDCPAPSSRKACGDVPEAGRCQGAIVTWCYDGALATVDCALSQQTCRPAAAGQPADCAGPASPAAPAATE